jgi:hypothetical protein
MATARPGLPGAVSSRHTSTWLGPLDLQPTYRLPLRRNADQQLRPEADPREDSRARETWPCEGVGGQPGRRLLDCGLKVRRCCHNGYLLIPARRRVAPHDTVFY